MKLGMIAHDGRAMSIIEAAVVSACAASLMRPPDAMIVDLLMSALFAANLSSLCVRLSDVPTGLRARLAHYEGTESITTNVMRYQDRIEAEIYVPASVANIMPESAALSVAVGLLRDCYRLRLLAVEGHAANTRGVVYLLIFDVALPVAEEFVEPLLDLARADNEAEFRDMAAAVGVQDVDDMWQRIRRRLGRETRAKTDP